MTRPKKLKDTLGSAALTLFRRQEPEVVDAELVDSYNSGGIAPGLVPLVRVFDNAPEAEGLFASHFGINLSSLAGMSPEQLGQQTDMILQAKEFASYIPIIEPLINDYIKAVVDYNTFISRAIKAGAKGIKEIDKSKLDVMLEWFGYKQHQEQIGRKADNEKAKLEADTQNYIALSDFNLDMALKMKATSLQAQMEAAAQRPELAAQLAEERKIVNERKQQVKQLIQYGTGGKK
jgi:hypothetical protein